MIHSYKLGGINIVHDVASGSIHCVDDAAFDAIRVYEQSGALIAAETVRRKYPEISEDEISELISEIETLKQQKKLFSTDSFLSNEPFANKRTVKKPIKALCLNVSHMCNMSCGYCFAGKGAYGAEPTGLPISQAPKLMPLETGIRAVDFLLENSENRKNLDIDFFGGEPLLNFDVVKEIVRYARSKEQGSGKRFRFTLTTNGLLIDDDVIDFTNKEMHNVVLSLDGRPETNDFMRKLGGSHGNDSSENGNHGKTASSYEAVLPKIKRLVEARGNKNYYIRGTFTRCNLDFSNDILHLAELGFTELAMEPVVTKGESYGLTANDLTAISKEYEKLAAEMIKRKRDGRGFSFYHFTLNLAKGPCVYKRVSGCGVGTEYLAVTPNGDLYPCHQFIGKNEFVMGDVFSGLTNKTLRGDFEKCGIMSKNECRECWARYFCSGGCAANAYNSSGSITGLYELGCEMFKKRTECAIYLAVADGRGY